MRIVSIKDRATPGGRGSFRSDMPIGRPQTPGYFYVNGRQMSHFSLVRGRHE